MRTIAVANLKGGIGKTTTAVNLAYNLTQYGKRVLLVDLDQQGNASSFYRQYHLNKNSVYEILMGRCVPSAARRRTSYKNLDIVPSNIRLSKIRRDGLADKGAPENTLKDALWALEGQYDYCVIDCPPAMDLCLELAIRAADEAVIPMPATTWAKEGLNMFPDLLTSINPDLEIAGILFTSFRKNRRQISMIQEISREYTCPVFDTVISRCEAVMEAEERKRPLAKCRTTSSACQDYISLTEEYLRSQGEEDMRCQA